jgi:hypothetical protein
MTAGAKARPRGVMRGISVSSWRSCGGNCASYGQNFAARARGNLRADPLDAVNPHGGLCGSTATVQAARRPDSVWAWASRWANRASTARINSVYWNGLGR